MEKTWSKNLVERESKKETSSNSLIRGIKKANSLTLTENLALTHKTSDSKVLDLFCMGGALRTRKSGEIQKLVSQALSDDFILAVKCLFYLRDIREGQGERRTFREGLAFLSQYYPEETKKLLAVIPEFGRWDDIFSLEGIDFQEFLINQIESDLKSDSPSLLGKWLPSENSGNKSRSTARALRKYLGFSSKKYRKVLQALRKKIGIVETKMSSNDWNKIEYGKLPGKASLNYVKAFHKHDEERYKTYLANLEKNEEKINTKTIYPYEIVSKIRKSSIVDKTLELAWKNLPDYTKGEKAIVVADTSGSMAGHPIDVSVSLAMYFAERNEGPFKNKFITFSNKPSLQDVKGDSLKQKILNLENADWDMNTNLQAVFDLILNTAVSNKVPEEDMPKTIYVISDMEFDIATRESEFGPYVPKTNFEVIIEKYKEAGYEAPQIVFWNVDSRQNNVPVKENENGVLLVSGASASVFGMVMEKTTPKDFMLKVLNSPRYKPIGDILIR